MIEVRTERSSGADNIKNSSKLNFIFLLVRTINKAIIVPKKSVGDKYEKPC
tara:strand:+ start:1023 stop:1175 length:153 start_codon:yes stop_codon:yes gene_type:complete